MSKLPKAGVGNSDINVSFESTVTANNYAYLSMACATDGGTNLWLSSFAKQQRNPCSGPHLCTRIWVRAMIGRRKKSLPICESGGIENRNVFPVTDSFSPLGAQNKDVTTKLQTRLELLSLICIAVYFVCMTFVRK